MRTEDFSIVHDELIPVPITGASAMPEARVLQIPLRTKIRYDPGATTGDGNVYVLTAGSLAAAGANVAWYSRIFYVDP